MFSLLTDEWLRLHLEQAAIVYKHGTYLQVLAFEWHELPELFPLHVFIIARTIALFLFGALCWRSGIVKKLDAHTKTLALSSLLGLGVGLSLTILTSSLVRPMIFGRAQGELYSLGELALTIGYAATIMYVTTKDWGRKAFGWAAPLGRMAFTNYVMQSVIFSFLFFGWGLGLFGRRCPVRVLRPAMRSVEETFMGRTLHGGPVNHIHPQEPRHDNVRRCLHR